VKIRVDLEACVGAGQCIIAAPTVFELTEDGKVMVLETDPGDELLDQVHNAVFACPACALELDES
jgi:ferredoxin